MAGNNKGFLDRYATPESIREEARNRGLSLDQCTAFTDGTKLAVEMCLVANAFGLRLLQPGMTGPSARTLDEVFQKFDLDRARDLGGVVDYVLGAEPGGSVFVIGYSPDPLDQSYMAYYKMGPGPYYLFARPYHLCHFETPLAIERVVKYRTPILVQKQRILEVGTRAKTDLPAGTALDGIGGYHVYGVLEEPMNLPIGLSQGTRLIRSKKRDEPIAWSDVRFPESDQRLELWEQQAEIASGKA